MGAATCGTCGHVTEYPDVVAGSAGKCIQCGTLIRYPGSPLTRQAALGNEPPQVSVFPPVAAAVFSFFIPGVGQLCQRRWGPGIAFLLCVPLGYLAFIIPGVALHIWSVVDAATN